MTKWPFNHKSLAAAAAPARLSPTALEIGKTTWLHLLHKITDVSDDFTHLKQVVSVGGGVGGGAYRLYRRRPPGGDVAQVDFLIYLLPGGKCIHL